MKSLIIYCCEHCSEKFHDSKMCEEHEARHYGLNYTQYKEWKLLVRAAKSAGYRAGICKRPDIDEALDAACCELVDFERHHRLEGYRYPENWA